LNGWKNYTSQLLNVYRASDQADRNKYSWNVSTRSKFFYVETAIAMFKTCKWVIKFCYNWFKQEVIQYYPRSVNLSTVFGIRKNCLISGRRLLFYHFNKKGVKTDCSKLSWDITVVNLIQNCI
jgi:hypothetical protein